MNTPVDTTQGPASPAGDVRLIAIEDELKTAYLDYAMSVIVARALPDVRDGLKPVHRRILYSCSENGYRHDKAYRKSARIVGDVIGKYHPHGDAPIYDALVRMAQDFSMSMLLIDGQGNFGSLDGDPPAAMRYTEARLAKISDSLLADLDKDTVNFAPNYDGSEEEPTVLPARFPNLLVNGAGGIAVGMATSIPPHNLTEVLSACIALIDDPSLSIEALIGYIPAPDFPTGAQILGRGGAAQAYATGRGSITMRAKTHFEESGRQGQSIVIDEIPYQVNKASLVEKIAELVKEKRVEGISGVFDESNRLGVRIVIELKRDANAEVILNQLYRFTPLQSNFSANMLAINGGRPELMTLRDVLKAFIAFREEVITRRTKFELGKARDRAHILIGLVIAVSNLDEVVAMIRAASSPALAREALMAKAWPIAQIRPYLELVEDFTKDSSIATCHLSEIQANAILELRLNRLTQLGRDEIGGELQSLAVKIEELLEILRKRDVLYALMRQEFEEVRTTFPCPRRSEIVETGFGDIDDEDLIQREDMVVTTTLTGYIKRVPLSAYRAQRRGGKGRAGMATKEEDVLTNVFVASTHTPVLFFTSLGKVYRLKVYRLPEGTPQSKGKAFVNLLPLSEGETVSTLLPLPEDETTWSDVHVVFCTAHGYVRRNSMEAFTNIPSNGKIAMKFEGEDAEDRLIGVALCNENDDILLAARAGKALRFNASDVREMQSRASVGVRGMNLAAGDSVISMTVLKGQDASTDEREAYLKSARWKAEPAPLDGLAPERFAALEQDEQFILTVTQNGFGKRTSSYEYRTMGRGNQGVTNIECSSRNGEVVASFPVRARDEILLVSDQGQLIRTRVEDIRIAGRNTQGVTLFKVAEGEHVVSVAHIVEDGASTDQAIEDIEDAGDTMSDDDQRRDTPDAG
jgi:DNA gyrase subunit A